MNLMDDRPRWVMIMKACAGSWRWRVEGGRGIVNRVTLQEPPHSGRIGIDITVKVPMR